MDLPLNVDYVLSAFAGAPVATPQGDVSCTIHSAGDLVLSTGLVVACDPLVFPEAPPFTVTVAPGTYRVDLAVAQVSETDQRVAFARLQFASGVPESWQIAVASGQDPSTLKPDQIFGYPVDAGTGCFMDGAAAVLLLSQMNAEEAYGETIIDAMDKTYVPTWSYADIRPSPERAENCITFSTGWGDGLYASYFAYSTAREPIWLVTDFDVLWRDETAEPRPAKRKSWWKFW